MDSNLLEINSPAIITLLRTVVALYPGPDWLQETDMIPEPFAILVHHEDENERLSRTILSGKSYIQK